MPVTIRKNPTYTPRTASPRGRRPREMKATTGLRISAISPATMKITSTFPAALAIAHRATRASGSSTSWTHRGTSTRGGAGEACSTVGSPSGGSPARRRSWFVGSSDGGGGVSETLLNLFPPSPEYG